MPTEALPRPLSSANTSHPALCRVRFHREIVGPRPDRPAPSFDVRGGPLLADNSLGSVRSPLGCGPPPSPRALAKANLVNRSLRQASCAARSSRWSTSLAGWRTSLALCLWLGSSAAWVGCGPADDGIEDELGASSEAASAATCSRLQASCDNGSARCCRYLSRVGCDSSDTPDQTQAPVPPENAPIPMVATPRIYVAW